MLRDIFRRGNRMQFKFGEAEKIDDPLGRNTFEPKFPMFGSPAHKGESVTVDKFGTHDMFSPSRSPIQKPGGRLASLNGPAPDYAELCGAPVPASTSKRNMVKPTGGR